MLSSSRGLSMHVFFHFVKSRALWLHCGLATFTIHSTCVETHICSVLGKALVEREQQAALCVISRCSLGWVLENDETALLANGIEGCVACRSLRWAS